MSTNLGTGEATLIAMWSGPRNISTAMMRAFENRDDCAVIDEPLYAAYLAATGLDHPGKDEILNSQSRDWRMVAKALCAENSAPIVYQKHMTQHILPGMDMRFTENFLNCFLIREPRKIIASYTKVRPDFELDELGFQQQRRLFEREADRLGSAPPVLDAALTLANPEDVLQALCDRLGIDFSPSMLQWPKGPRASDGVWAPHWYASVWESTGFASPEKHGAATAAEAPVGLSPRQERLAEEAEEIYQSMYEYALGVPGGT